MTDREQDWNADTTSGAMRLIKQIDYKFVCLLEIWSDVLISLDCTNKSLQGKKVTLDIASNLLSSLATKIQDLRKQGVQKYLEKSKVVCESMRIESNFAEKRQRKVKKMANEMAEDEANLIGPEKRFEIECFTALDRLTNEMETRSSIYHDIASDFGFLSGKSLSENSVSYLQKCAADLVAVYDRDIDSVELANELSVFKYQAKKLIKDIENASHLDILKFTSKFELKDAFPNIEISLRIFLTLPFSVASFERSFSKLKIIKNYLRSSMGENRLTNLAILSIKYEEAKKIDFEAIITEFASLKARRVRL